MKRKGLGANESFMCDENISAVYKKKGNFHSEASIS
jgi:hypothetical protein